MFDLSKKALERLKGGPKKPADSADQINPLKDAMKEAFDAVEGKDFDRFYMAMESAMDIRLADHGMEKDLPSDAEPYELDELDNQ